MGAGMKEQIAQAAETLIIEKKVKKLTVKEIVEECHITRQTFYYHFEDIPHMLQWMMAKHLRMVQEKANEREDPEERLKYMFLVSAYAKPYIDQTLSSNYGAELNQIIRQELMRLTSEVAEQSHQYQSLSREELELVLQYHTHAFIGVVWEYCNAPAEQVDRIVHTMYRIMVGKIALKDDIGTR